MRRWPAIVLVMALAAGVGELAIYRSEQAPAAHAAPPAPATTVATTTSTTTVAVDLAAGPPESPTPGAPAEPTPGPPPAAAPTQEPCGPDRVAFVVSVGSPTVAPGASVDATARQTNIGDRPCRWPGDIRFIWRDATGAQFELARADVQAVTVQWQPGQVLEQRATWDQRFANGSPAALGFAAVIVSWGPAGGPANTASAPFVIGMPLPAPTTPP